MDLFAGCGGLTLGLESTGCFESVFAVEADERAAETYSLNFPDCQVEVDLIQNVRRRVPRVDVVVGGPPCQGFSALNRNRVGLERRRLWRDYLDVLKISRAHTFVMENVPELLTSAEFAAFKAQVEPEFKLFYEVLNAADFGVPQRRRRAIVIGMRAEMPFAPRPTHGAQLATGELQPWRTFRQATAGLPLEPDNQNWHRKRNPTDVSVRRYAAVPHDGGNRFQMQAHLDAEGLGHLVPACWRRKSVGTTDVFGRLWWDRPALTIRTEFYKPEKGRYLHPSENRPITVREAADLMSFPRGFRFPEEQPLTAVGRQVGNAVPPDLARAIGISIAETLGVGDIRPLAA